MEIEPTYCTFQQAKLLKEKGFDEKCYRTYNSEQKLSPFPITKNMGGEDVDPLDYNWTNSAIHSSNITAPEQWQVVKWLMLNHNIFITFTINRYGEYSSNIYKKIPTKDIQKPFDLVITYYDYSSPKEAISEAIDYVLTNLI